ncbi:glycine zipper domain-containing protein [Mesorhizobium japonicum]
MAIDSIRDAPIKSVLYAAGVGVIIGLLLSR